MAGQTVQLSGILLKQEASGENFLRLNLLSPERGLVLAMLRQARKNRKTPAPDLFDELEVTLDNKREGGFGFVRELRILRSRRPLAKSFIALELACEWATILIKNLPREADVESVYTLLVRGLNAWEHRINPEAVLLKCLFLFARGEGYAVKDEWFNKLPHQGRIDVATILNSPIADLEMEAQKVRKWIEELKHYLQHYTDILL